MEFEADGSLGDCELSAADITSFSGCLDDDPSLEIDKVSNRVTCLFQFRSILAGVGFVVVNSFYRG